MKEKLIALRFEVVVFLLILCVGDRLHSPIAVERKDLQKCFYTHMGSNSLSLELPELWQHSACNETLSESDDSSARLFLSHNLHFMKATWDLVFVSAEEKILLSEKITLLKNNWLWLAHFHKCSFSLLENYYDGFFRAWHIDNKEKGGRGQWPVVLLSFGQANRFQILCLIKS